MKASKESSSRKSYLGKFIEKGWVQESKSPSTMPVILMPKRTSLGGCVWNVETRVLDEVILAKTEVIPARRVPLQDDSDTISSSRVQSVCQL
ncbi:hypothetical protein CR513_49025, partial [Mucuna pruriens]